MSEHNDELKEHLKDPMFLFLGMAVESSLEVASQLSDVIHKYESNGIDVVPISELKECLSKGVQKTTEDGSFTKHLIGELN